MAAKRHMDTETFITADTEATSIPTTAVLHHCVSTTSGLAGAVRRKCHHISPKHYGLEDRVLQGVYKVRNTCELANPHNF